MNACWKVLELCICLTEIPVQYSYCSTRMGKQDIYLSAVSMCPTYHAPQEQKDMFYDDLCHCSMGPLGIKLSYLQQLGMKYNKFSGLAFRNAREQDLTVPMQAIAI